MSECKKCHSKNVEWVKDNQKWRLYETSTGKWHNENCQFTKEDYENSKETKSYIPHSTACRHGILRDRWCDKCDQERMKGGE